MAKYKTTTHTSTLLDASTEYGDVEELKDEMQEWQESLESNNMEHLPKYEEVQECADTLESALEGLEDAGSELESALEGHTLASDTTSFSCASPYGRKGTPRWMRLENSLAPLRALVQHIEDIEKPENEDDEDEAMTEIRACAEEMGGKLEEFSNIGFPGMFG